jgi:hypothetical protein
VKLSIKKDLLTERILVELSIEKDHFIIEVKTHLLWQLHVRKCWMMENLTNDHGWARRLFRDQRYRTDPESRMPMPD